MNKELIKQKIKILIERGEIKTPEEGTELFFSYFKTGRPQNKFITARDIIKPVLNALVRKT